MSLQSKVAVVTGAARGFGRAIALKLASDGADVSVWNLNPMVLSVQCEPVSTCRSSPCRRRVHPARLCHSASAAERRSL